ncbi:MAG: hypothetical protein ACXVBH_05375 [Flavisolibacter sp.]
MVNMPFKAGNILCQLLTILSVAVFAVACNKSPARNPVKDVTGYTWNIGALRDFSDPYISPLPATWELNLEDDGTFYLNLNGATCKGTYSWTEIDSVSAHVSFSIKQWNDPIEYPGSARKLKNVLSGVNRCYILKGINVPPPLPGFTGPTVALDFEGNSGFVYWYR